MNFEIDLDGLEYLFQDAGKSGSVSADADGNQSRFGNAGLLIREVDGSPGDLATHYNRHQRQRENRPRARSHAESGGIDHDGLWNLGCLESLVNVPEHRDQGVG